MTHFVYVYANQGTFWDQKIVKDTMVKSGPTELYYSILSLHKFFQGPKKIFVVGDSPKIRGVIHIPHNRITGVPHPKAADSIAKLKLIANHPDINEEFVYMHDDMVLLKPCREADLRVIRANDHVPAPGMYFTAKDMQSPKWKKFFMRTLTILKREGLPMWNYETHIPRVLEKKRILEIISKYKMEDKMDKAQMLFTTLYYNNYYDEPQQVLATKPNIKIGVHAPHSEHWIQKNLQGKLFLNYDNPGLNDELKKYIKKILK